MPPADKNLIPLDEVAVMLAQIEPTDQAELSRVCDALRALATEASYPASVQKLLSEAVCRLEAILQGEASETQEAFAQLTRLIEDAAWELEENSLESGETVAQEQASEKFTLVASVESELDSPPPDPTTSQQTLQQPIATNQEKGASEEFDILPPDADLTLLGEFIAESREYIEGAEASLLSLETDPDNLEAVNTVFRAFHTIKGTSAFLGLTSISELAHLAESLLSRVRNREIRYCGGYADLSLRSVDVLKELIESVQQAINGQPIEQPKDYSELLRSLTHPEAAGVNEADATAHLRIGDILVAQGKIEREQGDNAAAAQGERLIGEMMVKTQTASLTDVAQALRAQQQAQGFPHSADSSVRVRTDRLDRLIDMIGELVIAQSMVAQDRTARHAANHDLLRKITHTGKIVRELQDLTMSMRMVPLKATFQKIARVVRDLTQKSGKLATFLTEGEDTEIDRHMVDVISDPLMHMIRNALDHGLESPDVREAKGKPRTGTVQLSAFHSSGNVVIEMKDDGHGLDREKILRKAIAQGLIESDRNLSENEIFNLIFEPGFSTAEQVTDISGRGVGMDVVKRKVEAVRGRINISSVAGQGTTFTILLPLTLAITDGMLVKVGQERYIIPTINIHLSFRPQTQALFTIAGRGEMVMLRDELMPLFRLHRLFNISNAVEDPQRGILVVVGDGDRRCALLVDELLGQHQVVVKSLGRGLGQVQGISGGAILGDGCVGLILDAPELAGLARQSSLPSDQHRMSNQSAA